VDQTVFDSVILQVFEEQEDRCSSLRYPLSTQRHALDFVKLINRKGFPYVLMCKAIDEQQEKFRSWRLGNGNAYIGLSMIKRINKTVQVSRQCLPAVKLVYLIVNCNISHIFRQTFNQRLVLSASVIEVFLLAHTGALQVRLLLLLLLLLL